jgi:hypothetical protein
MENVLNVFLGSLIHMLAEYDPRFGPVWQLSGTGTESLDDVLHLLRFLDGCCSTNE